MLTGEWLTDMIWCLLTCIFFCSFERPSAIQQRAIVPVVKGHDVIAQAQSGTGKTATFSISILQQVSPYISDVLSVCECMFRDLAR